jgi:acyl carrier protein
MATETGVVKYDHAAVLQALLEIVRNMTSDWETGFAGAPGPGTRLIADLGFESVDIVQLVVAIEQHFDRRDLPFEKLLMSEGRYVDEVRIGDAVDFLVKHLNRPSE